MEPLLVSFAAFFAAGLTLLSGFGLGTILMPVAAIFLPVPVAVAVTAVVHLLNNLFKLGLLWRNVNRRVLLAFGVPALVTAVPGALLLDYLAMLEPIARYQLLGHEHIITPVKLAAGILLIVFATAELIPFLNHLSDHHLGLPVGGILSGFFGGLSGHQGAFRSAFLIRARLDKNAFVATNAAIAALVDTSRIVIYGLTFDLALIEAQSMLILLATIAAFLGVFLGKRLLKKVTISFIQTLVATMLYLLGGLLMAGII
jgi:uncharacterized protein